MGLSKGWKRAYQAVMALLYVGTAVAFVLSYPELVDATRQACVAQAAAACSFRCICGPSASGVYPRTTVCSEKPPAYKQEGCNLESWSIDQMCLPEEHNQTSAQVAPRLCDELVPTWGGSRVIVFLVCLLLVLADGPREVEDIPGFKTFTDGQIKCYKWCKRLATVPAKLTAILARNSLVSNDLTLPTVFGSIVTGMFLFLAAMIFKKDWRNALNNPGFHAGILTWKVVLGLFFFILAVTDIPVTLAALNLQIPQLVIDFTHLPALHVSVSCTFAGLAVQGTVAAYSVSVAASTACRK